MYMSSWGKPVHKLGLHVASFTTSTWLDHNLQLPTSSLPGLGQPSEAVKLG
jgi:hypothetical protein